MGLDQYLTKRFYVKNWDHTHAEHRHEVIILQGEKVREDIPVHKISEIVCEVMYWRKANAIHKWFVETCQGGVDDCRESYVSMDQLKELHATCCEVLAGSKLVKGKVQNGATFKDGKEVPTMEDGEYILDSTVAEELLPTESGFFFGQTTYDQWYYQDIVATKEVLEKELAIENNDASYYYQSSW